MAVQPVNDGKADVTDLSKLVSGSSPDFKGAIDNVLSQKQISWGYKLFGFDLTHAGIKQENDTFKIYKIDQYKSPENVTVAGVLGVDPKDSFWKENLKKYDAKDTNHIFGLALKCNAYSLKLDGFNTHIEKRSIPFWMTVSLNTLTSSEFQVLFGEIQLINDHISISKCIGTISLSEISIKGAVFVFGLNLNGKLALTNGFSVDREKQSLDASAELSLVVSSNKDEALSYSVILNHWKKSFPDFKVLFDILTLIFSNVQIIHFKCSLSAAIGGTLAQTSAGKEKDKEAEEKKAEEDKKEGKEKKEDEEPSSPVKYAIKLEFQPQIDPKGMIGTLFKLLQCDDIVEKLEEYFPLVLYLEGDNKDGYAIGAKIEKRIDIKQWVFSIIYFDNFSWGGGIEFKPSDSSVTLSAQASLSGFVKIGLPGLGQMLMSGFISAKIDFSDPNSAEIGIGFVVKLGDEKGWDPFSLIDLDSGFKLKSLSMGMSVNAESVICIMCATSFNFLDNDVIIALKFGIDIPKECAYPIAFHFAQDGELSIRDVIEKLCPFLESLADVVVPDIKIKDFMFSATKEKSTEIVYDIEFKADDEDDDTLNNKKAIKMADALNNLDKYHMENKSVTIKRGLAMSGEIDFWDLIKIKGELVMSTSLFKMMVHFQSEEKKMEEFKTKLYNSLSVKLDEYEKELFPDSYEAEIKAIAKQINKYTLGVFDLLTGDGDAFFEAALSWGFKTAKLIVLKAFQIIKKVVKTIMDNISIYEFLYDLEISTSALPVFRFKIDMKIGGIPVKIDIDTKRDFSIKKFFKMLIDTKFWSDLIAFAKKLATEIIPNLGKKIVNFLWNYCGGKLLFGWIAERNKWIKKRAQLEKAMEEQRKQWAIEDAKWMEERKQYINQQLAQDEASIKKMTDESNQISLELDTLDQRLDYIDAQMIEENAKTKQKVEEMDNELQDAEKKYKEWDDKIKNAIDKTDVDESLVCKFLTLLNDGLIFALLQSTQSNDTLSTKMEGFQQLLDTKQCTLSIKEWFFMNKISDTAAISKLQDEDVTEMNEMLLLGYDDVIKVLGSSVSQKQKELIKSWCNKETAQKTWIVYQDDKKRNMNDKLIKTTPILIKFLDHTVIAADAIKELLGYDSTLNAQQKAAVNNASDNTTKWIKLNPPDPDSDEKENIDVAYLKQKQLTDIEDIDNIKKTADALEIAAKLQMSYVSTLRKELKEEEEKSDVDPLQREYILDIASTIESCCIEMIEKQCMVRKSVLMARQLIEYKPAKITSDAQPLWDVLIEGITDVYTNAIKMAKISAEFFEKFREILFGFRQFMSFVELKDQDEKAKDIDDLNVALEEPRKNVREFADFGEKSITPVMDTLKQCAENIITDCSKVSKAVGDSGAVTNAIKEREKAKTVYLKKREAFNAVRFTFSDKYNELQREYLNLTGTYKTKSWYHEYLKDSIYRTEQMKKELEAKQT